MMTTAEPEFPPDVLARRIALLEQVLGMPFEEAATLLDSIAVVAEIAFDHGRASALTGSGATS